MSEAETPTLALASEAEAFAVEPYTPREVRFHLAGAVLNGAVTLASLVWVLATWKEGSPTWP